MCGREKISFGHKKLEATITKPSGRVGESSYKCEPRVGVNVWAGDKNLGKISI